jgi:hypothetical protein
MKQYCAEKANCGMLEKQLKTMKNMVVLCYISNRGLFPLLSHENIVGC